MNDADIQIARLDERFAYMKEEFTKLEKKVDDIDDKLDQVLEALNGAKGGWKMMMLIGSLVASVAAGIAWVASHVSFK
jgi:archaellum component FlaC